MYLSPDLAPEAEMWEKCFANFSLHGKVPPNVQTLLEHTVNLPTDSIQGQLEVLSSISNFHWWVSLNLDGRKKSSQTNIRMSQHILTPQVEGGKHHFLPAFPRNMLMHFLQIGNEARFCDTVTYMLLYDREDLQTVLPEVPEEGEGGGDPLEQGRGKAKKRRYASRAVPLSAEEFCASLSVDAEKV